MGGRARVYGLWLICLWLTTAGTDSPGPVPAATPEGITLGPGGVLRIPADPVPGPAEANPQIVLHRVITDAQTHRPVAATALVDDQVIGTGVAEVQVTLPGRLRERYARLTVKAQDYQVWEIKVRWHFKPSRMFRLPVRLNPAVPQAGFSVWAF